MNIAVADHEAVLMILYFHSRRQKLNFELYLIQLDVVNYQLLQLVFARLLHNYNKD